MIGPNLLVFLGLAGGIAAIIAGYFLARRLPEGTSALAKPGKTGAHTKAITGTYMLVAIGDYGCNEVVRLLQALERSGLERAVGSILVAQFSAQGRARFQEQCPKVFLSLIIWAHHPEFDDGFGNRPEQTMKLSKIWSPVMERGTQMVSDLHERRSGGRAPGAILFFLSPGGHLPLGYVPVKRLGDRYDAATLIGATTLADMTRLRKAFPSYKKHYDELGLHGWLMTDSLGADRDQADRGLVGLLTGIIDASVQGLAGVQPTNVFTQLLPKGSGGMIVWRTIEEELVAFFWQRVPGITPPQYYVQTQQLHKRLLDGLDRLPGTSDSLATGHTDAEPDTATYTFVLLPLHHRDVEAIGQAVRSALSHDASLQAALAADTPTSDAGYTSADHRTVFASIATRVAPQRPVAPIMLLRVQSVRLDSAPIEELVKPPLQRRMVAGSAELAAPAPARLLADQVKSGSVERPAAD